MYNLACPQSSMAWYAKIISNIVNLAVATKGIHILIQEGYTLQGRKKNVHYNCIQYLFFFVTL